MGLVSLMDKASKGETANVYEFTMAGKADELVGKIANGDLEMCIRDRYPDPRSLSFWTLRT